MIGAMPPLSLEHSMNDSRQHQVARWPWPHAPGKLAAWLLLGALFIVIFFLSTPLSASSPAGTSPTAPALDDDDRLDVPLNPGGTYRPGVPSPDAFLGWPLGQRFTPHARIIDYMKTLAATGSDRCRWESYGATWEDRPLGYLVISSPANLARTLEIRKALADLSDPETTSRKDAEKMARETPAVVWFSYNVHGSEASASEAAMAVAYELVGGTGTDVLGLIDSLIVILDPCLNPDGRDRYVSRQMQAVGRLPDASGATWEHDEPWPGGRYNHYLFDLNRDWAWLSQPESRGRVGAYRQWHPQVHVDFHEMWPNSSYFFFPAAEPIHAQLPQQVRVWGDIFGRGNAEAFDRRGWNYFTAESFDLLYPGYGDSWPTLQGATGMTYEQAGHGLAGLAWERPDGSILTLRERLRHHVEASMATLATTRRHREARLLDFHAYFLDAVTGRPDAALAYLFPPAADEGRRQELVQLLLAHGIRVEQATGEIKAPTARDYEGNPLPATYPAGTYVVPGRQPLGFLVHALLEPETTLPETLFYDISAWSLPLAFGLDAAWTEKLPSGPREVVTTLQPLVGGIVDGPARTGWLLPWDRNAAPKLLYRLLQNGIKARFATKPFEIGGRYYERGTILIPVGGNSDSTRVILDREARRAGISVYAVQTGLTGTGIDLGSDRMLPIKTPRVAIVTGDGVDATSFGALWFLLDRQYEINCSVLPLSSLGSVNLAPFTALIFPDDDAGDGSTYNTQIDSLTTDRIRRWTRDGGTVIGLKGGAGWATSDYSGLTSLSLKGTDDQDDEKEKKDDEDDDESEADALQEKFMTTDERERKNRIEDIPGSILRVELDPGHPLAFGYQGHARVFKSGDMIFEPSDSGRNVAWYPPISRVSGYLSVENEERLAMTPFLVVEPLGRGRCVLYNEDPNFRLFWFGLNRLFLNSLFFAGGY